jgi:sec-independent protein translocase protein TatA
MHLMILAIVVLVLFGGKKLPELGKGLGEGLRGFKEGMKGITDDATTKTGDTAHTVTPKPEESPK